MVSLRDFKDAPPRRQFALVLAAAGALAVVMLALYFLFLRSSFEPLFRELSVADAARITAALDAEQIPYRLQSEGSEVLVPGEMVDGARLAVMSADLPLESMVGFELFNESNLGLTEFAQRINYQRALQGELARTIMALDTVEAARIHISMPEPTIFRGDRTPATASVTIASHPDRVLLPETVNGIQRLITAAVPNLEVANVVVLNEGGRVVSSSERAQPIVSPDVRERNAVESYYAARIERELTAYRRETEFEIEVQVAGSLPTFVPNADVGAPAQSPPMAWAAGERDFALIVTIATELASDQGETEAIRTIVERAIGSNPAAGDAIAVTGPRPRAATPDEASAPNFADRPSAPPAASPSLPFFGDGLWALVVVIVGGLMFLLIRSRRGGAMSDTEREAFATQLRRLLEDAAPSASR